MSTRQRAWFITALVAAFASHMSAQSNQANTTLQVTVGAEASISIAASSYTFTQTGTVFNNFTLSTPFNYKVRTAKSNGTGAVVATFSSDFAGAGGGTGPSIASNDLTYTSSTTGAGSAPGSAVTAQVGSTGTNVLTFGANARSSNGGDTGTINWVLANKPQYETDTYTATVVLTISAS